MAEESRTDPNERSLLERIAIIEATLESSNRSLFKKISTYAAFVALFISISSGILSLYNSFFVAPRLQVRAETLRISDVISTYNEVLAAANSLPASAPQEQKNIAIRRANLAGSDLVAELEVAGPEVWDSLGGTDLIFAAWAAANNENFVLAKRLVQMAEGKATTFVDRMTAKIANAQIVSVEDFEAGREYYKDLLNEILESESTWRPSAYYDAATQMLNGFAARGRCQLFREEVGPIREQLLDFSTNPEQIAYFDTLMEQISQFWCANQ